VSARARTRPPMSCRLLNTATSLRWEQFSHAFSASDGSPTGVMIAAPWTSADAFVHKSIVTAASGGSETESLTKPLRPLACKERKETLKQGLAEAAARAPCPAPVRSFANMRVALNYNEI
jgi:hypothetical protein